MAILTTWTTLRDFAVARSLSIQWAEDSVFYFIQAVVDGESLFHARISKTLAGDAADKSDFETTYKTPGNKATNTALAIRRITDLNSDTTPDGIADQIRIGDGTNTLKVNADGSVNISGVFSVGAHASPIFSEFSDTLTTLAYEPVFSYTSASLTMKVVQLVITASQPVNLRLKIGTTVIREARTSPLERNVTFLFMEHRSLSTGQVLSVEAQAERLIISPVLTFTAMEGYIA